MINFVSIQIAKMCWSRVVEHVTNSEVTKKAVESFMKKVSVLDEIIG